MTERTTIEEISLEVRRLRTRMNCNTGLLIVLLIIYIITYLPALLEILGFRPEHISIAIAFSSIGVYVAILILVLTYLDDRRLEQALLGET